jgi:uncharacterized protein YjdB
MIKRLPILFVLSILIYTSTYSQTAQTISFSAISNKYANGAPFVLSAVAQSGLDVSFTVTTGTNIASVSGDTVTLSGSTGQVTIKASQGGDINFAAAPDVFRTFYVTKAPNTITFGTIASKYVTDTAFSLTATASSGIAPTFTSSNAAVATVTSGGTVTITGAGTTTITANEAGDTIYNAASAVSRTLTVLKLTNTVTLASIPSKYVTDSAFSVSASATNGTITYSSSNTSVATINASGVVTLVGAGTTTITASVAGSATYLPGSASRSFTVSKKANVVTLASIPAKFVTDTAFTVSATATNGTITYSSSNTAVATIDSTGKVTITGAGSTTIVALVPASTAYLAGSASKSFIVSKNTNTVTLATIPAKYITDTAFSVSATATNGTITYSSSNTAVATINASGVVTIVGLGNTTITASVAASANYLAGTASKPLVVSKQPNVVTLAAIPAKHVTDSAFTVSASATNGTITYSSSNTAVATINGSGTVTLVGAGSTTITASVAASSNYLAGSASRVLTVSTQANVVTLASIPAKYVTDPAFTVSATATYGTIVYTSSNTAVATIDSTGLVTLVGAGNTTIIASVPASTGYAAGSASKSFNVSKKPNTVTLASIPSKFVTDSAFTVSATATNGTIVYSSSNTAVATIDTTGKVTLVGAGSTTITASVPASASYLAGAASKSFIVSKNANTVTLATIPPKYITDTAFSVSATATNGIITYSSSNTAVATINASGVVTIVGLGSTTITAAVAASSNYLAGSASKSFTVSKQPNVVTLAAIPAKYVTDSAFSVSASATNGTIAYSSSNTAVATINASGVITLVSAGSTTITASVAASSNYLAGTASQLLTVSKKANVVTLATIPSKFMTDSAFAVSATAVNGTIGYTSSNTGVATIDSTGLVTIVGVGNTTITASVPASASYLAGSAARTFSVSKKPNTVVLASIPPKFATDLPFSVSATATNGTIVYSSSNTSVATINASGLITIVGVGGTTITASVPSSANYLAGSSSKSLTVSKQTNVVSLAAIPGKYVGDSAFTVTATATNGTPSYLSSNTSVATIDSTGLITIVGAGSTTITALVGASASYHAGSSSKTFIVSKRVNTVTLAAIPPKYMTDTTFMVSASATNGTINYSSSNPAVATIDATGKVTVVGIGSTAIIASVPASAEYLAGSAQRTLQISKASQTITWSTIGPKNTNSADFPVTATASSGLTTTITVVAGPAIYTAGTIHLTGVAGTVILSATQAGNGVYSPITKTISFTVVTFTGMVGYVSNGFKQLVLSVDEPSAEGEIQIGVYPNPSTGTLYFNHDPSVRIESVSVFSSTGQLMMKENYNNISSDNRLDLTDVPEGVYFVRFLMKDSEREVIKRVIINN